jgi:hypothetical protein
MKMSMKICGLSEYLRVFGRTTTPCDLRQLSKIYVEGMTKKNLVQHTIRANIFTGDILKKKSASVTHLFMTAIFSRVTFFLQFLCFCTYAIFVSFSLVYFLHFFYSFAMSWMCVATVLTSGSKGRVTTGGQCVPGRSFLRMRRCTPFREEAYRDGADCICLNSLSQGRKMQCSGIPAVIELAEPLLCYTVH